MKIIPYTAISGGFEPAREDILCFTKYSRFTSHRMNAKIYKCLPHIFIPDAAVTIWLDGNIRFAPGVDITEFVREFLGDSDVAAFRHPYRKTIAQEADTCIELQLDDMMTIQSQMMHYAGHAFYGVKNMAECGVLVRRNRSRVNRMNETWWSQICAFSSRDQISFPYALFRHYDVDVRLHQGNVRTDERFIYTARQSSKP